MAFNKERSYIVVEYNCVSTSYTINRKGSTLKYTVITENLINPITGEISTKDFKEIIPKSKLKGGFRMCYKLFDKALIEVVKGEKDLRVFLHIKNIFTKQKIEIALNARKISEQLEVSTPKVSSVISKMVKADMLMRVERGLYRLNPFAYIPYQSSSDLQKEWLELKEEKN